MAAAGAGAAGWFHPYECLSARHWGRRLWRNTEPFRLSSVMAGWLLLSRCCVGQRLGASDLTVRRLNLSLNLSRTAKYLII